MELAKECKKCLYEKEIKRAENIKIFWKENSILKKLSMH